MKTTTLPVMYYNKKLGNPQIHLCTHLLIFMHSFILVLPNITFKSVVRVALSGWTVRDRISVGTRFSARLDRPWGPPL